MNTEHDWLVWWHDEGSGMRPINGQDHESHVRDMTRIAWLNGAFGAADEIERLRAECDRLARRNTILVTDIETLASAINKATAATAVRTLLYRGEG